MKRLVAFILLLVIIGGVWAVCSFTNFTQLLTAEESPTVFMYKDHAVTQSTLLWIALIIPLWLCLTVIGFVIDPVLGYFIFRIGLIIIGSLLSGKSSSSSRSGSGSGSSGRGG